ncbi:MAG: PTS galactitol transporter subunit IIC, partial [Bifidobacterium psychraerophilum]|nr:PTS galactitol transporter subunit IIC [Bifidobacterium psychraerophilum]
VFVWVVFAIVLKVADLAAPYIQKEYNIKGISFPHLAGLMWSPVAIGVNWVVDRIPGLKKVDFNAEKIQKRFGAFGEPVVLGFILGLIIGVLAGYSPDKAITLAINVAAAMVLLPKMIDVLLEGLITVRDAAEIQLKKWFPKREFFIGMDTALLIGEPSVLASGLLLIPIAIVLALILPGNKMLPFADLASLTFLLALVTPFVRRNMFKMLITGTLSIIVILYVGSAIAPFVTQSAVASNIKLPSDFTGISNMTGAVSGWVGWLGVKAGELFNMVF